MNNNKHITYLKSYLGTLPGKYKSLDSQKMLALYMVVTGLELLHAEYDYDAVLTLVRLMEVAPLQFKNSTLSDSEATIVNSYCGVAILKQLKQPLQASDVQVQFVRSLMNEDYCVRSSNTAGEADLRMVYSAVAYLDMLGLLNQFNDDLNKQLATFIMACQNGDGGFGLRPHFESHGGATYCAIASLKMLNIDIPNRFKLIEWLSNRHCSLTGGVQGRINKVPDSCYSFWVGWALALLGCPLGSVTEFLSHCEHPNGGFSKFPNSLPDPVHTLHSLFVIQYKLEQLELKGGSGKFEVIFAAPDTQNEQYSRFSLRAWWIVLQAHREKPFETRMDLYERAFKCIPNCYKLWFNYLKEQLEDLGGRRTFLSQRFERMVELFEKSLVYMHKMPNLWLMYADFMASMQELTRTRNIYDRALQSLPVTQHHRIWKRYCEWISSTNAVKTTRTVYLRYLKVNPDYKEEYLDYLVTKEFWDEACQVLVDILNDDQYGSSSGRTKYDFVQYLCEVIARHPDTIKCIEPASIIQYGIKKYSDEIGQLWIKLADYYIKIGQFEKARDVFEEAVNNVMTVKDFALVFNSYVKFEESMIQMLNDDEDDDDLDDAELAAKLNQILHISDPDPDDQVVLEDEIQLKLDRLDGLLRRRPLLLNSCLLRQNKYNVQEWLTRIELVKDDERIALKTFTEALETVESSNADNGKLSDIWVAYARYYRAKGDYKSSNQIMHKGTKVEYKHIDEYVNIWSLWIEQLLEDGYINDALLVIKQALFKRYQNANTRQQSDLVPYSLKLWELYADLERNFGNFKSLRAAYKRMVELKVVTPFIIISFANLLEENAYFEEAFKVFENGVALFQWPALYEVWIMYITKFIQRYKGQKVERTRNLFETVLEQVPLDKGRIFYLMYGEFEEEYGLLNHAIEIYDRMVFNVNYEDKMEAYNIYIAKVAMYLGITKTRAVFESAISNMNEPESIYMGLRLAQLERKFGEIDRARAVYVHISQFSDPRFDDYELWKTWENFELHHGNEDTYKEFRRISKSVVAKFQLMPPDPKKIKERVDKGQL